MRATRKIGYYLTFTIDEIGRENFNSLIRDSLKKSTRVLIDDYLPFEEAPIYKTQVPYFSGYIDDRYAYLMTQGLKDYLISEIDGVMANDSFFSLFVCWDFYINETLILSINIVQGQITVHSLAIDLGEYKNVEVDLGDEE